MSAAVTPAATVKSAAMETITVESTVVSAADNEAAAVGITVVGIIEAVAVGIKAVPIPIRVIIGMIVVMVMMLLSINSRNGNKHNQTCEGKERETQFFE